MEKTQYERDSKEHVAKIVQTVETAEHGPNMVSNATDFMFQLEILREYSKRWKRERRGRAALSVCVRTFSDREYT